MIGGCHVKPEQFFNLIFGYNDRWTEDLSGIQSGAGTWEVHTTAVPAGYIYLLQFFYIKNTSGARGTATLRVNDGTDDFWMVQEDSPGRYEVVSFIGNLVLKEGDIAYMKQVSCADGDEISCGAWGYKMKLTQ